MLFGPPREGVRISDPQEMTLLRFRLCVSASAQLRIYETRVGSLPFQWLHEGLQDAMMQVEKSPRQPKRQGCFCISPSTRSPEVGLDPVRPPAGTSEEGMCAV